MKIQKVSREQSRKLSLEILAKAERERNKFAEAELKMSDNTNHEAQIQSLMNQVAELQKKVCYLKCLEACGVDNWEGCSDAVKMMRRDYPEYCDEEDDYNDDREEEEEDK
jgi:hypothetical protein